MKGKRLLISMTRRGSIIMGIVNPKRLQVSKAQWECTLGRSCKSQWAGMTSCRPPVGHLRLIASLSILCRRSAAKSSLAIRMTLRWESKSSLSTASNHWRFRCRIAKAASNHLWSQGIRKRWPYCISSAKTSLSSKDGSMKLTWHLTYLITRVISDWSSRLIR